MKLRTFFTCLILFALTLFASDTPAQVQDHPDNSAIVQMQDDPAMELSVCPQCAIAVNQCQTVYAAERSERWDRYVELRNAPPAKRITVKAIGSAWLDKLRARGAVSEI